MPFSTSSTSGTGAAPGRSSPTIPGPATASRKAPFRQRCGCTADLKRSINCQRIGRCPSACSESTCSPSALKTAVICSAVFPEFLWLATGGLGQFNDRVKVLLGRQVIAFPDLGACDKWRKKAKDYPLLDITVSDYLEMNATPQQREMGADLADLVVEERS